MHTHKACTGGKRRKPWACATLTLPKEPTVLWQCQDELLESGGVFLAVKQRGVRAQGKTHSSWS